MNRITVINISYILGLYVCAANADRNAQHCQSKPLPQNSLLQHNRGTHSKEENNRTSVTVVTLLNEALLLLPYLYAFANANGHRKVVSVCCYAVSMDDNTEREIADPKCMTSPARYACGSFADRNKASPGWRRPNSHVHSSHFLLSVGKAALRTLFGALVNADKKVGFAQSHIVFCFDMYVCILVAWGGTCTSTVSIPLRLSQRGDLLHALPDSYAFSPDAAP